MLGMQWRLLVRGWLTARSDMLPQQACLVPTALQASVAFEVECRELEDLRLGCAWGLLAGLFAC